MRTMDTHQAPPQPENEGANGQLQPVHVRRIHAARLCVLVAALAMTTSGLMPVLLLDESAVLQRMARLVVGTLHGVAMFGCLFLLNRGPALALAFATLIVAGVVGANLLSFDGGAARGAGLTMLAAVMAILWMGANAAFASARVARR